MFIINYSVPCLCDGTITHLLHLVWKQWADATTCTVTRNELVEILARLKRPIELAGEAFQREELKSSLQESRQIGLSLLWFDVWLDVKSVGGNKRIIRPFGIQEEKEEKDSADSENWVNDSKREVKNMKSKNIFSSLFKILYYLDNK